MGVPIHGVDRRWQYSKAAPLQGWLRRSELGIARLMQAGVVVSDYATLMMEVMRDNNRPETGAVYGAIDKDWANLVGQLAHSYGK
jgi:hypothetical protein